MISLQTIEAYKASLIPTPETDLRPRVIPSDVPTFDPLGQGRGGWTVAGIYEKTADLINKVCNFMQFATDERQHELEEERRWFELEGTGEPSEETLEHLDLATDAARTMREQIENKDWKPADNAFQWAKQVVAFRNPWEAFEFGFDDMQKSPSCSDGLVVLFMDAYAIHSQAKALMASNIRSNMVSMAKATVEAVERDMGAQRDVTGKRPADTYRRWAKALRWIIKHELHQPAFRVLREMILDQSLPIAELDAPEWIDPYTCEVDMQISDRVTVKNIETEDVTLETQAAMHSEGFDSDDGMETELYHTAAMTAESEWDVREPMWMEMQNDLRPSDETRAISGDDAIIKFRSAMKRAVREMNKNGVMDVEDAVRESMHAPIMIVDQNTGEMFPGSNSQADLAVKALTRLARTHDPKDIATVYIGLEHNFGFYETDAARIHIQGSLNTLEQWLDVFGDELMESFTNDSLGSKPYNEHEEVVRFANETLLNIVEQARKDIEGKVRPNVFHHPVFIEGFLRAMSEGSATTYKDTDGKWRSSGVKAGWENWMRNFNASAFQAYLSTRRDGKDFEKSKSAFWTATKQSKKVDTITGLMLDTEKVPCGLVLGSGRKIDWKIFGMKLEGNELTITDEQRTKLQPILKKIGLERLASLV